VLGLARIVKRYKPKDNQFNERLRIALLDLVQQYPRYGYRKITTLLRKSGWLVNKKRVFRLWQQEGLRVPRRKKVKRNKGHSHSSIKHSPATHINNVWTWDFLSDSTVHGKSIRWLLVKDEFTRECLLLEPRWSWKAKDVVSALVELIKVRGTPLCIRSDNGSEFIAKEVQALFKLTNIKSLYIEPGSPWQNGSGESFVNTFRSECLNEQSLRGLKDAKAISAAFKECYNTIRPHHSLKQLTPEEYRNQHCGVINTPVLRFGLVGPSASSRGIDNSATRSDFLNSELSN
jgi:transposase InsO family protein